MKECNWVKNDSKDVTRLNPLHLCFTFHFSIFSLIPSLKIEGLIYVWTPRRKSGINFENDEGDRYRVKTITFHRHLRIRGSESFPI